MINFIDEKGIKHSAIVECKKTKGVNGEKSLSGTIYTNDEILEGIGRGWRLEFENEKYCLTYVYPIDEGNRIVVEFDAVHEFFFDLNKKVVYSELNGSNTAKAYLDLIFNGSGYSYLIEVNVPSFEKESFGMRNRLDLFKEFISDTGVEFSVNGKVVRILEKVGSNLSTIVKKGFNLNELRIEKDPGSFITYKKGFGAWHDDDDHSKGRLEVEYLSPLASIYGKLEGDPIVDERYKVASNFETRLKNEVESSYGVSVDIDMEDLTKAGYEYEQPHEGDYIMAINKDLGFEQKIRIMSYETSYDTNGNIIEHKVSCGSDNIIRKSIKEDEDFRKEIQAGLEGAISTSNKAWVSASGKNAVFEGPDEPTATAIGDTWFQIDGDKKIMRIWNGYEWKPVFNPGEIEKKVEQAEQDIIDTAEKAQAGLDKSEEAIIKADFLNDAVDIAVQQSSDAVTRAQQAQQSANDLLGQVTEIEGTLTTVESVVDELNGQMALKVNTTEFNQLTGIVDSHTTQIGINAGQIAIKANKDYVDTINNQVESVQTELTVQAGEIRGLSTSTNGLITEVSLLQSSFDTFRVTLGEVQTEVNGAVKSTVVEYYLSTSLTTVTGGSWVTTAPPWTVGKYMWSRTKIVYVNGNISYSPATCIAGAQGQQGAPGTPGQKGEQGVQGNTGATGKSVSSIIPQYAMTTSKTTAPTTGWTTTAPTWIEGRYIWTRSQINWANPTSTSYTTPVVDSALDAVTTKYSDLQIKVDGIQSTVSRIDGDYATNTKVTQLADQWTQTTNLANGHTGQISNLGEQINLRVTQAQVDASILKGKRPIENRQATNDSPIWYLETYGQQTVYELKDTTALGLGGAGTLETIVSSVTSLNGSAYTGIKQTYYQSNGDVYTRTGEWSTSWSVWARVADTSNILSQINLSTEGVLIQGKKVQITGETYIQNGVIKTAHIADLSVSGAKIANASISSAKIISLDASKITAGTINTSLINIIATSGNKRVQLTGSGLSAIDENGKLRLAIGIQDIAGDGQSDPSNILFYTGNGSRSFSIGTNVNDTLVIGTEASNQFVLMKSTTQVALQSWDIRFAVQGTTNNTYLTVGRATLDNKVHPTLSSHTPATGVLGTNQYYLRKVFSVEYQGDSVNIGYDNAPQVGHLFVGSWSNVGVLQSYSVYNRTASMSANVGIGANGVIMRTTSARKYKTSIVESYSVKENAKKILGIKPVEWLDKAEIKETGKSAIYYGFIADEFYDLGLKEVVMFDSDGQIEGLAYDRISMYHNVILSEHEKEIMDLRRRVSELEKQVRVLQMAA